MDIKKKIVLIPYWIENQVRRSTTTLTSAFNLAELKTISSTEDIAAFLALQKKTKHILGYEDLDNLYFRWLFSLTEGDTKSLDYLNLVAKLTEDPTIIRSVESKLFDPSSKSDTYKEPFKVYDLDREICGVVIYPGFFVNDYNQEQQTKLIEAILKVLYAYNTYDEVAKTSLFLRYVEVL